MPKKTLVKNLGWDNTGIHCNKNDPISKVFLEQELDNNYTFNDFIFDENESKLVNNIVNKSIIGEYNHMAYLKTRIKEFLYKKDLYSLS